jgi:hypothetical protein
MFNNYYWQRYSILLEYKDKLDDYLENLKSDSPEYKKLDNLIGDILDIQYYIEKAYKDIEKDYADVVHEEA